MDDQKRYQRHDFDGGRSAIVLAYLQVNQAWAVFREDGGVAHQQRTHPQYAEAESDFRDRVAFVKQMEGRNR